MKVRISDSAFVSRKRKEPKNRLFHRGDFELIVDGNPYVVMTYKNTTRKNAIERAMSACPGHTFNVKQLKKKAEIYPT